MTERVTFEIEDLRNELIRDLTNISDYERSDNT